MGGVMLTRRNFLKSSAAALPALALQSKSAFAASHQPIGVQLYTVRSLLEKDPLPDILKQIHAIGYQEVEAFPACLHASGERTSAHDR